MLDELRPQSKAQETLMTCPNCGQPAEGHPKSGCVLGSLIGVLRNRGNLDEEELLNIHRKADTGVLWSDLGPILDRLEDGFYTPGD